MPLTMASIGEANTIRKVGGNEETKRFLENLGFKSCNKSGYGKTYHGLNGHVA